MDNIILLYRLNRADLSARYTGNRNDTGTRHNAVDQDGVTEALSETTPKLSSRYTEFLTNHPQRRRVTLSFDLIGLIVNLKFHNSPVILALKRAINGASRNGYLNIV